MGVTKNGLKTNYPAQGGIRIVNKQILAYEDERTGNQVNEDIIGKDKGLLSGNPISLGATDDPHKILSSTR
jgi:hypothetical protein